MRADRVACLFIAMPGKHNRDKVRERSLRRKESVVWRRSSSGGLRRRRRISILQPELVVVFSIPGFDSF